MMLYPSLSDLLKKVHNRYSLVNVAAKRARDIAEQAENDPQVHLDEKPVSMALDDIMNGVIIPIEHPVHDVEENKSLDENRDLEEKAEEETAE